MKYLLPLLILINCHEIKGVLEWTVVGKVTDYGQNVTLFCNVPNCCPKDAGWDRWTPNQRTLFIDVKTGRPNKKYDGKVEKDGYTLVIQNLTKNDLNVSYSCLYGVTLGEQKYLLAEDVFTYKSTAQPNVNNRLSEGQVAGIIVGVIVLVAVALSVGLLVFHFQGTTKDNTYESVSQTDKGPPSNLAINPSLITVTEGQVITATCSATGNPNPTFEWRKLGSDDVISSSSVLTINNAQESHKGKYICKAINTMGSGEVQTTVTVHYKPKVTIKTTLVQGKKGHSVEIPCEFTSYPYATSVTWTKIVGEQSSQLNLNGNKYRGATVNHPSLTILDLQASDIADYRCSVLNTVDVGESTIGRVNVDLTELKVSKEKYFRECGSKIEIKVEIPAKSKNISWFHNGRLLETDNSNKYERVSTSQPSLTIKDLNIDDRGTYVCKVIFEAENKEEKEIESLPVEVVPQELKVSKKKYAREYGSKIEIKVVIPTKSKENISWFHNGRLLKTDNSNKYGRVSTSQPSLKIKDLNIDDRGTYVCKVIFETEDKEEKEIESLPVEVEPQDKISMDSKDRSMCMGALKSGEEKRRFVRIQVVGKNGVGKTSLVRRLLKQDIEEVKSTDGIELTVNKCQINTLNGEWIIGEVETDREKMIERIQKAFELKENNERPALYQSHSSGKKPNDEAHTVSEDNSVQAESKENKPHRVEEYETKKNLKGIELTPSRKQATETDNFSLKEDPVTNNEKPCTKDNYVVLNTSDDLIKDKAASDNIKKQKKDIEQLDNSTGIPNENQTTVGSVKNKITMGTLVSNMDEILLEAKKEKDKMISENLVECGIWDFAGQKDYYATHQTFCTPDAIYIIVADIDDHIMPMQEQEFDSIEDYIDFWFDSVHCFCKDSTASELCPPVIMVITGLDRTSYEDEKKVKEKEYRDNFQNTFKNQNKVNHKRYFNFISNKDNRTEDFDTLRSEISKIAADMSYFVETRPTKWIELEYALMAFKDLNTKKACEKWENIKQLAEHLSFDDIELISFLEYQHKIGNIIFFKDNSEYIILQPDWLVKCFRCLVCDKGHQGSFASYIYDLNFRGKLKDNLIDGLFGKDKKELEFGNYKTHILNVMEKYEIIVKPQISNANNSSYYMPCMIKKSANLENIIKDNFMFEKPHRSPWLILEFDFLPLIYFNHILFNYIKNYTVCNEKSHDQTGDGHPCLYKGKAVVYLDTKQSKLLIICFSKNAISLQIYSNEIHKGCVTSTDTYERTLKTLCERIKDLEEKLKHNLKYKIKSKCSTGKYYIKHGRLSKEELARRVSNGKYACQEDNESHNSKEIENTWLIHAAAIENSTQAITERDNEKQDNKEEEMKIREGEKSRKSKTKTPKIIRENDVQLPWLVDADEFESMLLDGEFKSFENRLSLGGPCKAGKSTLASVLIGEEIQKNWESTDGLVIYFGRNGIDLEKEEMVPLKESQNDERGRNAIAKILQGSPQVHRRDVQVNTQRKTTIHDRTVIETPAKVLISESATDDVKKITNDITSSTNQIVTKAHGSMTESGNEHKKQHITNTEHEQITQNQIFDIKELQIKSDILKEVSTGQYKIKIAPSDLIDFGGQKSFDMTHQLSIQHSGSFLLMFDGRFGLHDQLDEYPKGVTAGTRLKHWVESILTYSEDTDDIMPKIMFAATHRDLCMVNQKETEGEIRIMKESFIRDLTDMFADHAKNDHLYLDTVYFINGVDKNDPEIKRLTKQVVIFAMQQSSWGQRRPMQWVPLELQLSNMRMQNINIITKEVLQTVNKLNIDLDLNERQLNDFLLVQHSLGKLMYYSFAGLDNFIIIHPPALVNILRSFVTDEKFFPDDKKLKAILQQLSKTGKISKEDLLQIWQQDNLRLYLANDAIKEFVVQLLIHLDILVIPKMVQTDSFLTDVYLVPCMIKNIKPSNFLQQERTISLRYSLTRKSIPIALAYKVIGATINAWPLKYDDQKKLCLYHKAVIVNVSEQNELRVLIENNLVNVYLTNKESLLSMSPDIAASVQECLTKNLEASILFHYSSCGRKIDPNEISDKYTIDVGFPCGSDSCYISSKKAENTHSLTCPKGIEHQTKYLLHWTFNKKQQECGDECEGLTEQELKAEPSEKHLVRLANLIEEQSFKEFVNNLGVTETTWRRIQKEHEHHSLVEQFFIALTTWKNQLQNPTLKHLVDALVLVDPNRHLLCQVFREKVEVLNFANINLQDIPDKNLLTNLSKHIGNCPLQLGIELGLTFATIQSSMYECKKRGLPGLLENILFEWKETPGDKTFHSLGMALQQVNSGGLHFLRNYTPDKKD